MLALSWQVTYLGDLGWKDTFGSPRFTARQWDYAHAFHRGGVATPEVVVNGRADVVGSDRDQLEALIRRADRGDSGPSVSLTGSHATVGAGAGAGEVLLVRYDPNIFEAPIKRGENGGRTLPHKNIVRDVVRLGDWTGKPQIYTLPSVAPGGLSSAILVQAGRGGPILAAARS